jgi:agmatinase
MAGDKMFSSRLVLSTKLAIESIGDNRIVVFHTRTLSRLELTKSLYQFLCNKFTGPAYFHDAVPPHLAEKISGQVALLIEKGFLLTEEQDDELAGQLIERKLSVSSHSLFNSQVQRDKMRADVSVVGVPYDLGNGVAAGARKAPDEIRVCSYDYDCQLDFFTGKPLGWIDVEQAERILEGVTICDWGNIWFRYGESPEAIFKRIGDVCDEIIEARSFPLFMGGDHSITFPIVERLQLKQPMAVLWLDAHNDYGEFVPGVCSNHKNVARHIASLPNIYRLVQVGVRGYSVYDECNQAGEKISVITPASLRQNGMESIVAALPESLPCYISIDIDVLDPSCAPGTSTPVPGGLSFSELKAALRAVASARNVVGLDLVEVNPEKDIGQITSIISCHLLLNSLGAIMRRQKAEAVVEEQLQKQTV